MNTEGAKLDPAPSTGFDTYRIRSEGLGEDFEVYVGMPWDPPSDAPSDHRYPTALIADTGFMFGTALETCRVQAKAGEIEPTVVIGLGPPRDEGPDVAILKRMRHFTPSSSGDAGLSRRTGMRERLSAAGLTDDAWGGADLFLEFIENDVLPSVADRYPIALDDVGFIGHSAGGVFATHALINPHRVFSRFVIGTFFLDMCVDDLDARTNAFLERAAGLPATPVFFGMGEREFQSPFIADMINRARQWIESLDAAGAIDLKTQIFPDFSHNSMIGALIGQGVNAVWGTGQNFDGLGPLGAGGDQDPTEANA